jgi:oxygen-independent coproporphyrinogen-3 oxidase
MVLYAVSDEPVRAVCGDGVRLALYRARPAEVRSATPILLVHGTFSNRHFFLGRNERGLARYLAERGLDAWVAELRGHGRSGPAGRAAAWHFEDWIRRDAPALVARVLEATGAPRLVWVGHSAGGIIGLAYAGLDDVHSGAIGGLVLVGSPAPTGLGVLQVPMAAAALTITRVMGRFPARLIGIGPEDEHAGIMRQWMRWNLSGRWHGEDGTDYFANCARVTAPILALAGAGDWAIAPPALCEDLVDATTSGDRTFVTCGRAEGFGEDFNHNRVLVSTPARREVWPLIADWIEGRFA